MSATIGILLIHAIGGAIGGTGIGVISKNVKLGMSGNIIVGTLGGVFGGWLLQTTTFMESAAVDVGSVVEHLVGGAVAGAIVATVVGIL